MRARHRFSRSPPQTASEDAELFPAVVSPPSPGGAASPVPVRCMKAAVRVRPLLDREKVATDAAEVIRVVTAAGRISRSIAGPYILEVLQPATGGGGGVRARLSKLPSNSRASTIGGGAEVAKAYAFDYCAGPTTTQEEFFDMLEMPALCEAAMSGEVVTVFCFGQTGSGKTYTLSGRTLPVPVPAVEAPPARKHRHQLSEETEGGGEEELAPMVAEDGLQYQAIRYVARRLKEARRSLRKAEDKRRDTGDPAAADDAAGSPLSPPAVTAKCSYVELYEESLYDLLQPDGGGGRIRCRWSAASSSFFVEGSLMVECRSREDFLTVLREGQRNRQRGSHALNEDSSRSHAVFTTFFESRETSTAAAASVRYGRLVFVDLAGSERLKKTQSTSSSETGAINQSLFTLGRVLELLSAPPSTAAVAPSSTPPAHAGKAPATSFIPYRSSVLTQLLMHSLDGHGRTVMVACVSPSVLHVEESMRTIHYAERARRIRATPVVHVDAATQHRMALEAKVQELQRENALLRDVLGLPRTGALQEEYLAARIEELRCAWRAGAADGGDVAARTATTASASPMTPRRFTAPSTPGGRESPAQRLAASRGLPPSYASRFAAARSTSVPIPTPVSDSTTGCAPPEGPTVEDSAAARRTLGGVGSPSPTRATSATVGEQGPTDAVSILALLEALPDTRALHKM